MGIGFENGMNEKTVAGTIRKPRVTEVPELKRLVDTGVEAGALLPRTAAELCESLRDFHVYVADGRIEGCCALHVDMADLAEIRTLLVAEHLRGTHIGVGLLEACIGEAHELGLPRLYALTRVPGFFQKHGFREIDKHELPHKVFRDCVRCPLFPDCDEVALIHDLEAEG